MVCLAASIVSKNSKVLLSRQFVDMNRIRVEALLAAFPKLLGTGEQHTYVETDSVRYVYQLIEGMYLLLITNKQSNILEDLETLRLLSKVVPEYLDTVDETSIAESAFELLFAFDEVISLGHKEEVNINQVCKNTDMFSYEEDLANAVLAQKMEHVKSHMRNKAQEIVRSKQDGKFGSQSLRSSVTLPSDAAMGGSMEDGPSYGQSMSSVMGGMSTRPSVGRGVPKGPSKGMKLSKDKKNDIMSALAKEGVKDVAAPIASSSTPAITASTEPVTVTVEEKLSVRMNKEGGLESMSVQGTLTLLCADEEHAYLKLALEAGSVSGVQLNTWPGIDKELHRSKGILSARDPSKPFPVGVPQGILKWRFQSTDIERVPITINCWPTPSGSETYINMEYEATTKYDLQNVVISIPGVYRAPTVNSCNGDWRFDSRNNCVLWTIELIDESNSTGSMELVVDAGAPESYFPCTAAFTAQHSLYDLAVSSCVNTKTQEQSRFEMSKSLSVAKFEIVH